MPLALKLIAASACPSSARAQFRFQSRRIPCALGRTRRDARERAGTTTTTRSYRTESGHNKLLGFEQTTHSASTSVTHQYDAAGNLQSDGLHHYHYDSQGRLQSSQTGQGADAPTTRYAHNALGQRVFKTEPLYAAASGKDGALDEEEDPETPGLLQTLRDFFTQLWNPAKSEAEHLGWAYVYDEDGSLLGEYGMGGSQSAGQSQYLYLPTSQGPIPMAADIDSRLYAIHTDHLGTPRRLTQADGQAAWQWAYSAYGDEAPTLGAQRFTNETTNPTTGSTNIAPVRFNLRYPGQYFDAESGLHYNYFRSYDPRTGRYTQSDPIGLDGGWNRFAYVGGNPLSYIDPEGLQSYMCGAAGLPAWCDKPKNPPTVGVFGCVGLACLTGNVGDTRPTMSLELTLGGGIEVCSPPPPPPPETMCERKNNSSWQPPGIPIPERYGGLFIGPSIKRNGQICVKIGPHMSIPMIPSIDMGGDW